MYDAFTDTEQKFLSLFFFWLLTLRLGEELCAIMYFSQYITILPQYSAVLVYPRVFKFLNANLKLSI